MRRAHRTKAAWSDDRIVDEAAAFLAVKRKNHRKGGGR